MDNYHGPDTSRLQKVRNKGLVPPDEVNKWDPVPSTSPGFPRFHRRAAGYKTNGEHIGKVDIRSARCFGSEWINCDFDGTRMALSDFRSSRFISSSFSGCSASATVFDSTSFDHVNFYECDLEQSSFATSVLTNCLFEGCRLSYATFSGSIVKECVFRVCDFRGGNLDFVETKNVHFEDCNFWSVVASFGCQFWNATFDADTMKMFAALLARKDPDPRLIEYAGEKYEQVKKLMAVED